MRRVKLKFHTGPTIVNEIADKMKSAGLHVTCIGTEHVYLEEWTSGDHIDARITALDMLRSVHGTNFGLK